MSSQKTIDRLLQAAPGTFQAEVAQIYAERNWTADIQLLGLGLCEEAGEVAAAILDSSRNFIPSAHRERSVISHELVDCLIYICALANAQGIELGI